MAWRVYADPLLTADMTSANKSARFTPNKNLIMDGAFTWIVFNEVGAFTNLRLNIYSDRGGSIGALIATSTKSYGKADIFTDHSTGIYSLGFSFSTRVMLNQNTYYNLVLSCDGYTFSEANHMAWIRAWPDPIYNQPAAFNDLGKSSYQFGIIGADL